MNYESHYNKLINRARNRTIDGYSERHHIVPRCIGGSNDESNIVCLTPEEHFVAHQLLIKLYPGVKGLAYAVIAMTGTGRGVPRHNKAVGWLKRRANEARKNTRLTADHKQKIGEGTKNPSPETRVKIGLGHKGKSKSEEWKRKNSLAKSQIWKIVSPDGNESVVVHLMTWAKQTGITYAALYNSYCRGLPISRGTGKGFQVLEAA